MLLATLARSFAAFAAFAAAFAAFAALARSFASLTSTTHEFYTTTTPHSDTCADLILKMVNLYNKNNNRYNNGKRTYTDKQ